MGRTTRRADTGDPILALGLLIVGVLSLCVAALYPLRSLLAQSSPAALVNAVVVIPADTYLIVAGCLVVSAVTTTLGLLLLFVRL